MVKVKCCVGCQRNCKCLRMTGTNRKVRTGTGQPVLRSDSSPQRVKRSPLWGSSSSVLDSAPNVDSLGRLTGNSETRIFMVQSSLPAFITGVESKYLTWSTGQANECLLETTMLFITSENHWCQQNPSRVDPTLLLTIPPPLLCSSYTGSFLTPQLSQTNPHHWAFSVATAYYGLPPGSGLSLPFLSVRCQFRRQHLKVVFPTARFTESSSWDSLY